MYRYHRSLLSDWGALQHERCVDGQLQKCELSHFIFGLPIGIHAWPNLIENIVC
jgi:hypothetical protein